MPDIQAGGVAVVQWRRPVTIFSQDRLQSSTHQMWQSKSHAEGQPHWATESVSCTQGNLAAKSPCDRFADGTETGILIWDTKNWLKQCWNMEIVDSKWKLDSVAKVVSMENNPKDKQTEKHR